MHHAAKSIGIALSGGPDSLGLLALATQYVTGTNHSLHALIVDHRLRPESTREAQGVAQLVASHGVTASVLPWIRPDALAMNGKQRAARWARYALLAQAAKDHGLDRIWLGQNAEDQIETVWMRWTKGSGLYGLAGQSARFRLFDVLFERPVLGMAHHDLYAAAHSAFGAKAIVNDPTNLDAKTWRGAARLAHGRGVASAPQSAQLLALAHQVGRWRAGLERQAHEVFRAAPHTLTADQLHAQPFACAAWINRQSVLLTGRETGLGFDAALGISQRLHAMNADASARTRVVAGGVMFRPTRAEGSRGKSKVWTMAAERDSRQRLDHKHYPQAFWQRLFKIPSLLSHHTAFGPDHMGFAIASPGFGTTLAVTKGKAWNQSIKHDDDGDASAPPNQYNGRS